MRGGMTSPFNSLRSTMLGFQCQELCWAKNLACCAAVQYKHLNLLPGITNRSIVIQIQTTLADGSGNIYRAYWCGLKTSMHADRKCAFTAKKNVFSHKGQRWTPSILKIENKIHLYPTFPHSEFWLLSLVASGTIVTVIGSQQGLIHQ